MKMYFTYGQEEIDYLTKKDKRLGAAIARLGMIQREVNPDVFSELVSSIVGQQISTKAAITVHARLAELLGEITPETLSAASIEDIQKCGMSMRKAGYIKGIGESVTSGILNIKQIPNMEDNEIIKTLSSLNGIGVWTAEMLLIFCLQRPNVVSWGDLAIRRGMMNLYGHKTLTKVQFEKYKKRYAPFGTVASLYLWAISIPQERLG